MITTPNRLKINLSLNDPSELKVREGDPVTRGQVLSDKEAERTDSTGINGKDSWRSPMWKVS